MLKFKLLTAVSVISLVCASIAAPSATSVAAPVAAPVTAHGSKTVSQSAEKFSKISLRNGKGDLHSRCNEQYRVTPEYCKTTLDKIDSIVRQNFYDATVASTVWPSAVAKMRPAIESSKNLQDLADNINLLVAELHSSHCQFTTVNDETFYFLHSLFGDYLHRKHHREPPKIDFTGAITGGVNAKFKQVRYILDDSPASHAGLEIGDEIVSVNGHPFVGQLSFAGTSKNSTEILIRRGEQKISLRLVPQLKEAYGTYIQALKKSVRIDSKIIESGGAQKKIAYIHFWCGGSDAHDLFEEILSGENIHSTDGLILDLRDGYGAAYFDDLDYFYRPAKGYPAFRGKSRKGLSSPSYMFYDKPVVALINGGVRSGKELMAYSLKQTGRAQLVGEKTAGAVVGGRLFPLDSRTSLYLAVSGPDKDGVNLEGSGVMPDVEIRSSLVERGEKDLQLEEAEKLLNKMLIERH